MLFIHTKTKTMSFYVDIVAHIHHSSSYWCKLVFVFIFFSFSSSHSILYFLFPFSLWPHQNHFCKKICPYHNFNEQFMFRLTMAPFSILCIHNERKWNKNAERMHNFVILTPSFFLFTLSLSLTLSLSHLLYFTIVFCSLTRALRIVHIKKRKEIWIC